MNLEKEIFKNGGEWEIEETVYHPARESIGGTLFCIGNGAMGLRGSYEELGTQGVQGLYVAGVYRKTNERLHVNADTFCRKKYIFNEELMTAPWLLHQLQNLPDPLLVKIFIDDVPFRLWDGKVLDYSRSLDLRSGVLSRRVRWDNGEGKLSTILMRRFCSMADRSLIVQKVSVVPENWSGTVRVESGIDAGLNTEYEERIDWGNSGSLFLNLSISSTGINVAQTITQRVTVDQNVVDAEWRSVEDLRRYKKATEIHLQQGQTCRFEKFCSVSFSDPFDGRADCAASAIKSAESALQKVYAACCAENEESWARLWQKADIRISGDTDAQKLIRYAIFHLLIASPQEDSRSSIAAKALSGNGYHGHVFWDTDINLAPFYQWVFPSWAKGHCQYRYRLLDSAREDARGEGRAGARYPWCTLVGGEQAPVAITCGKTQIHVMPDIAYAMFRYLEVSGDEDWWRCEGLEVVTECLRYMVDRISYAEDRQCYEILGVGGPDEYHPVTDNNAYTNYLTAYLLRCCVQAWRVAPQALRNQLGFTDRELELWGDIAGKMCLPADPVTGLIPQCDGFFDLKDSWSQSGADWGGPGAEYHECKGIKQPDVILLLALLPQLFERKHLVANWDYYERFILHGSSLSPSIHALIAAKLGLVQKARHYFNLSARFDFDDFNNDTHQGIHIGNFGGLWQAMMYGFAGMELRNETLYFAPSLPEEWKELSFWISFRGCGFHIRVSKDKLCVQADPENARTVEFFVFGRSGEVRAGDEAEFVNE